MNPENWHTKYALYKSKCEKRIPLAETGDLTEEGINPTDICNSYFQEDSCGTER